MGGVEVERHESIGEKYPEGPESGDVTLVDAEGNVRRIPVPSSDPNDPLNMSKWRKCGILITCCWYSIFSLVLVGGAGPILPFWIEEYTHEGKDAEEIVKLTTYPSLVMALGKFSTLLDGRRIYVLTYTVTGAFSILPLSIVFGRRPVLLACTLLLLGSTVGAAMSQSYNTHMACRVLQGVATGATESVHAQVQARMLALIH